ncbi:MAG: ribosome biogenesis GTPase Der [Nitrospirae bacterium]|nr:ribosome biogenesis GTPase Der [Nitrospirota bacterium]
MARPIIAIVGRQNVGKSTLFNKIVGRRRAIVEDFPGVTRDRLYEDAQWEGMEFTVIDTGGIVLGSDDELIDQVRQHAIEGIEEADLVIHLLDGKDGLTPLDQELTESLRKFDKMVLRVVNKIDTPKAIERLYDFFGIGDALIPVSAESGLGFDDMMDECVRLLSTSARARTPAVEGRETAIAKVAIVGRPNAGKSTMINALLGKQRMIVDTVAGTTRDAVDCPCTYYGKRYMLIDTAGMRRKGKVIVDVERFSVSRTLRGIERADVVVLLIDAVDGIVDQDKKIVNFVDRTGKGLIILLNKWDLIQDPEPVFKIYMDELDRELGFASYAPVVTTSGLNKKRITKIFPLIDEVVSERQYRLSTGLLNRLAGQINSTLSSYRGKQTRVLYMTQVGVEPPQFAIFANYPEAIKQNHVRYIENTIRAQHPFKGTPVRVFIKKRTR